MSNDFDLESLEFYHGLTLYPARYFGGESFFFLIYKL